MPKKGSRAPPPKAGRTSNLQAACSTAADAAGRVPVVSPVRHINAAYFAELNRGIEALAANPVMAGMKNDKPLPLSDSAPAAKKCKTRVSMVGSQEPYNAIAGMSALKNAQNPSYFCGGCLWWVDPTQCGVPGVFIREKGVDALQDHSYPEPRLYEGVITVGLLPHEELPVDPTPKCFRRISTDDEVQAYVKAMIASNERGADDELVQWRLSSRNIRFEFKRIVACLSSLMFCLFFNCCTNEIN